MGQTEPPNRRVLVVTPAFNAVDYIDEAIWSVVTQQAIGATLYYHVQDGGSKDGTVEKLLWWRRLFEAESLPAILQGVRFSYASQPDGGMYDALQKGFDYLAPRDADILTWINCDDALAQGAVTTVSQVFDDVPGCEFLSGRIALLNQAGGVMVVGQPTPYVRADLAAGLHDGRTLPFIMQEGTFFSGRVWNAIGGVATGLRLAGDWDLWCRMAAIADHFTVDSITGFHRRRPGQLSGDMDRYYREVDATKAVSAGKAASIAMGTVVRYDQSRGRWLTTTYDKSSSPRPALLRAGRSVPAAECKLLAGFDFAEGPFPEHALPAGVRWLRGVRGEIDIVAPVGGRYRVRLTVRVVRDGVTLGVGIGARELFPVRLNAPEPFVNQVVEIDWWLEEGPSRLVLDCGDDTPPKTLLLIDCEAAATEVSEGVALAWAIDKPRPEVRKLAIAVVCADQEPELLERSLAACAPAVNAGAALFVVFNRESTAVRLVIDQWSSVVRACFDAGRAMAPDVGAVRSALHDAGFKDVLFVDRGSLLVEAGLQAAIALLDHSNADAVHGLVETPDYDGRTTQLTDATATGPIMFRRRPEPSSDPNPIRLGCALVRKPERRLRLVKRPVIWLVDGDRPIAGRTPAILLGGALQMLGYDVRYSAFSTGAPLRTPRGAPVISSLGCAAEVGASATISINAGVLRLEQRGSVTGRAVGSPLVADTDQFTRHNRAEARRRLGVGAGLVVCIGEGSSQHTDLLLKRIRDRQPASIHIVNAGAPATIDNTGTMQVVELGATDSLTLLSYVFAAADFALTTRREPTILGLAAWSCGLPLFDIDGVPFGPPHDEDSPITTTSSTLDALLEGKSIDRTKAMQARDFVLGARSLAALALRLNRGLVEVGILGGLEGQPPGQVTLRSGRLDLKAYPPLGQPGPPYRAQNPGALMPMEGAAPLLDDDTVGGVAVHGAAGTVVLCIDEYAGSGLRLHYQGVAGQRWTVEIAGQAQVVAPVVSGDATLVFEGVFCTGPHLCRFTWIGDGFPGQPLAVTGWEVMGEVASDGTTGSILKLCNAADQAGEDMDVDGDWRRVAGFRDEEPRAPGAGLHTRFRWSVGQRYSVQIRVARGGRRKLQIALSAGLKGQTLRPVVADKAYDWCDPLQGPIGRVEYREWMVDWIEGDIELSLELNETLRSPGSNLGVILFSIRVE